jgi:hypothetical protein
LNAIDARRPGPPRSARRLCKRIGRAARRTRATLRRRRRRAAGDRRPRRPADHRKLQHPGEPAAGGGSELEASRPARGRCRARPRGRSVRGRAGRAADP